MFPRLRGRWRWLALGGVLCVVAAGAAVAYPRRRRSRATSRNPDVEFTDTQATSPTSTQRKPKATEHPMDDGFAWPEFGYTKARTRYLPLKTPLRPPFVTQWSVTGRELIEFPPVLCRRSLYLQKNNGALYKISRLTGRVRWKAKIGYLAASSPACAGSSVYAVVLARGKGIKGGRVIALDVKNGRVRWSRKLPSRAESSPLVASGRVYFGTEDGTVYALRARDGAVRWRYKADGAVKGGLALDQGRLFFGDYGGKVHAIRQRDGSPIWETSSAGTAFGLKAGQLLLDAGGGLRARLHRLARRLRLLVRGLQRQARLAPQDRQLRLLLARRGQRARRRADGLHRLLRRAPLRLRRALGAACAGRTTPAARSRARPSWSATSSSTRTSRGARRRPLGAVTGKLVWATGRGAFNPIISDGRRLYFLGYSSLFMLASPRPGARATSAPATASPARPAPAPRGPSARPTSAAPSCCASTSARSRAGWRRGAPRCAATPPAPPAPRDLLQEPRPHGLPHPAPAGVRRAPQRPHGLPAAQA